VVITFLILSAAGSAVEHLLHRKINQSLRDLLGCRFRVV
jgi:hypothetical protein